MWPSGARGRPRTLTGRLLLWHVIAVLGVLLSLGLVVDRVLEHYFVDQLTDSLVSEARAVQQALPTTDPAEESIVRLGRAAGVRITIIRVDGVVLADSEHDPGTMENHRTRPEVTQALAGHVGVSSRASATIGVPFRYVALPPQDGRIVRVALPLTAVRSQLGTVRLILAVGFALAALAGFLVLSLIAGGLSRPLNRIASSVDRVGKGDLAEEVPEEGTEELAGLARTVNRMRAEVSSRIEAVERERLARDAILAALDEGIALFDSDGSVVYQNESSRRLTGGVARVGQLTPSALQQMVSLTRETRRPGRVEVTAGPTSRTIDAAAVSLPDESRVLLVTRDVTEARAVDAVRRDFVANASHELKTPVASLQALAETIGAASVDDPEAVPRFASQLEQEAIRLGRVVSDLLDLSRLEGASGVPQEVRLDRIVADELGRVEERAREASLQTGLRDRAPTLVRGSPRDLSLMVRNLLENAVQYTQPGGRVDVSVLPVDGEAVIEVKDSGIGIPARDRARVFERFYRVDRGRSRQTGGTGLGLSIVKHVAENHGGRVELESALGVGSTFIVRLPLASTGSPREAPESVGSIDRST